MGKRVKVNFHGREIEYELIEDWKQFVSEVDVGWRGESAYQLKDNTIKGIIGTMSLIYALGHTSAKITSMARVRSDDNKSSQHYAGTAIDIVDKSGDESWYSEFAHYVGKYSDNFQYQSIGEGTIGAWYTCVAHQGTGWHFHFDNYLGGLCGETEEEIAKMTKECTRTGGGGGNHSYTGSSYSDSGEGLLETKLAGKASISVGVNTVRINPRNKTFCEPVYPDLIYIAGNIPNSPYQQTVTNNSQTVSKNGTGFSILTAKSISDLTGINFGQFTESNALDASQKAFDFRTAEADIKTPSAGKPLNDQDPFPVDLKIEELEMHMPRVKMYKHAYDREHVISKTLASSILKLSDATEKRLVKLENNLATIMRYTFATGSRVSINCQYWGGTDHRNKYITIRCLHDNRCDDGQIMQLDQCLSCSRYEPLIGQTYSILSEVGSNLSEVQDTVQSSYINMNDYKVATRIEEMMQPKEDIVFEYTEEALKNRDPDEMDFIDLWGDSAGVKMNWKLVPVEIQKPQINWQQSINSKDAPLVPLESNQLGNGYGSSNVDPGFSTEKGISAKSIDDHYKYMQDVIKQYGSGALKG